MPGPPPAGPYGPPPSDPYGPPPAGPWGAPSAGHHGSVPPGPYGSMPPPLPPYPPYPPHLGYGPPPPHRHRARKFLVPLAVAAVALAAGIGINRTFWQPNGSQPAAGPAAPIAPSGSGGGSTGATDVSSEVDPTLVVINTVLGYQDARAAGTGIVLSSTGEILTNNHVIDGATSITATDLGNGRTYTASVVGYDSANDLAVLKLSGASGLATAKTADSSKVQVGDQVTAIGNAGGTGSATPASGTVTGLDQSITASDPGAGTSEQLSGMIQVNADVQAGDSGGSLVNSSGAVIGIDTAGSDAGSGGAGQQADPQGFAIPIDTALPLAKQIMAGKSGPDVHIGQTAFLGVQVATGSGYGSGSGAPLAGVITGSPAAQAGLAAGDVITAVDSQSVSSPAALTAIMASSSVGHPLTVEWTDAAGTPQSATITPISGPAG
ncbi:S1C family serine protease [Kitasatospora viridis]|uniref:S1C family serine protease n=1 Tax=Kitasatospora viridis TaxID=281105 RepID=UPI001478CDF2|nr:trypsin-like peptidase domain-containing protein [Kitasatospora viridis]